LRGEVFGLVRFAAGSQRLVRLEVVEFRRRSWDNVGIRGRITVS
jgi:hypothetical protein